MTMNENGIQGSERPRSTVKIGVQRRHGNIGARGASFLVRAPLLLLFGGLAFSSCTCQKELPDPPKRESRLRDRSWSGLPTPRRERRDLAHRSIKQREFPVREMPSPLPTRASSPLAQDELPDDFPDDIPLFDGAEIVGVQKLAAGAKNVLFHSDADIPEVFGFYRSKMGSDGWNVEQEYEQGNQSFLSFEKNGMITNMTVARDPDSGKQIIAVMYYKQEPLPFEEF